MPLVVSLIPMAPPGFPDSSVSKELACNAEDPSLIPGSGRSVVEGKGCPLQYSSLENSMDCMVHAVTKSRTRLSDLHLHWPSCHRWTVRPLKGMTRPEGVLSKKCAEKETQRKPRAEGQGQEEESWARIKNTWERTRAHRVSGAKGTSISKQREPVSRSDKEWEASTACRGREATWGLGKSRRDEALGAEAATKGRRGQVGGVVRRGLTASGWKGMVIRAKKKKTGLGFLSHETKQTEVYAADITSAVLISCYLIFQALNMLRGSFGFTF